MEELEKREAEEQAARDEEERLERERVVIEEQQRLAEELARTDRDAGAARQALLDAEWEEDEHELRLMTTPERRWLLQLARSGGMGNVAGSSQMGGTCWNCRIRDQVCERPR